MIERRSFIQTAVAAGIDVAPAVEAIRQSALAEHTQRPALKKLVRRPALKKVYRKLVTREARFFAHKALGTFCVVHAAFRLSRVGPAESGTQAFRVADYTGEGGLAM